MTREEAIAHARNVRNKSKNASLICLDAEVIDALLASLWHKVSEEKDMPKEETFMVTYPAKYCPDYCYYEKHLDKWVVNNLAHPFEKFKKLYTHWMEIPELSEED